MGNLANELMFQGRLADSVRMYEETLGSPHQLGLISVEGDACYSLGKLSQFRGDLPGAMNWFSQAQPLPTPLAWYFYQLPEWFQHISLGFLFFVELGAGGRGHPHGCALRNRQHLRSVCGDDDVAARDHHRRIE
jgi:hypothetical protein